MLKPLPTVTPHTHWLLRLINNALPPRIACLVARFERRLVNTKDCSQVPKKRYAAKFKFCFQVSLCPFACFFKCFFHRVTLLLRAPHNCSILNLGLTLKCLPGQAGDEGKYSTCSDTGTNGQAQARGKGQQLLSSSASGPAGTAKSNHISRCETRQKSDLLILRSLEFL